MSKVESTSRKKEVQKDPSVASSLRKQLLKEGKSMSRYTMASGIKIPANIFHTIEAFENEENEEKQILDIRHLVAAHDTLAHAIAPAKPRTILLLDPQFSEESMWLWLGPVPLLRRMMFFSLFCLFGFITVSLSEHVNPNGGDILRSDGLPLFINLMFFVFAAGLGASFSALFQANSFIVEGTFDPKHEASYWIRIVVGIIAGIILASLIPLDPDALAGFGKPTLSMLGGFSAALVYRILNRLVSTIESFVRGDTKDLAAANEKEAKVRAEEDVLQIKVKTAVNLLEVQKAVSAGKSQEEIQAILDKVLNDVVPVNEGKALDIK